MSSRGGRGGFRRAGPNDARVSSEVQIFVEGLPRDVKVPELCQYFATVGRIKNDRLTKKPRVWLYHDKGTGEPTGECTITYCDTDTQKLALETYDGQAFGSSFIRVTPSIVKSHMAKPPPLPPRGGGRGGFGRGGRGGGGGFGRGGGGGRGGRGGFRDDRGGDRGLDRDFERRGDRSRGYDDDDGGFDRGRRRERSFGDSTGDRDRSSLGDSRLSDYSGGAFGGGDYGGYGGGY